LNKGGLVGGQEVGGENPVRGRKRLGRQTGESSGAGIQLGEADRKLISKTLIPPKAEEPRKLNKGIIGEGHTRIRSKKLPGSSR